MNQKGFLRSLDGRAFLAVMGIAFLAFFAQNLNFLLMFDGLTYNAIAKNILRTGDWKTLHYSFEHYVDFYQHPPLAMWMQALVFKVFSYSEPTARFLSSSFAVATVGVVFWFTRFFFGVTSAFTAALVLITSTRFMKWGTNFYLDGILAFFCFTSVALMLVAFYQTKRDGLSRVSLLFAFFAGISISLGFMTKGVVVYAPALLILGSTLLFFRLESLLLLALFFCGSAVSIALWIYFLDGLNFLHHYFGVRDVSAISKGGIQFLLAPWINLKDVWLPWWPVFLISPAVIFWKRSTHPQHKWFAFAVILFSALSFPLGFSVSNQYLEHYNTPFYPFASVIVGVTIALLIKPLTEGGLKITQTLLLIGALFLATVSPRLHHQMPNPVISWIAELKTLNPEVQQRIHKIAFSQKACEIWYCIAMVNGKTDWQATGDFNLSREVIADAVLITRKDELAHPSWKEIPCLYVEGFKAYSAAGASWCR